VPVPEPALPFDVPEWSEPLFDDPIAPLPELCPLPEAVPDDPPPPRSDVLFPPLLQALARARAAAKEPIPQKVFMAWVRDSALEAVALLSAFAPHLDVPFRSIEVINHVFIRSSMVDPFAGPTTQPRGRQKHGMCRIKVPA
jgi:hypothetical protein